MCRTIIATFLILISSCSIKPATMAPLESAPFVYHIQPNPDTDKDFSLCDPTSAHPYYSVNTVPERDKREILHHFLNSFNKGRPKSSESGWLVIRFVVNCNGVTGRFRAQALDFNYKPYSFSDKTTSALLDLTKKVERWKTGEHEGRKFDSYYYFCFKIEKGLLIDVLP
jgi:hypothetical protein